MMKKTILLYWILLSGLLICQSFDVQRYSLEVDLYKNFLSPFPHSFNAIEEITFTALNEIESIKLDASNKSILINKIYLDGKSFSDYHHLTYQGMVKMAPVYAKKVIQMTAK